MLYDEVFNRDDEKTFGFHFPICEDRGLRVASGWWGYDFSEPDNRWQWLRQEDPIMSYELSPYTEENTYLIRRTSHLNSVRQFNWQVIDLDDNCSFLGFQDDFGTFHSALFA